jgi:hypothetical protein
VVQWHMSVDNEGQDMQVRVSLYSHGERLATDSVLLPLVRAAVGCFCTH